MRYSIICVDDDEEFSRIVNDSLNRDSDIQAEFVLDSDQAFRYLAEHKVDVVITGVAQPQMDGLAMTREILRRWPEIKVIILSGVPWDAREAAFQAGAKAYLRKPVKLKDLLKVTTLLADEDRR